jgi:hypothetical protein
MQNPKTHRTLFQTLTQRLALLLTGTFLLASSGCRSLDGPGSASFASVTISNRSAAEIMAATTQVFIADGYRGGQTAAQGMVFDKEASRATSLSREGLVGTQAGAQTINRVRVDLVSLTGGQYRLQCQAFMVTGGSDPFFQDEVPLANLRRRPYQSPNSRTPTRFPVAMPPTWNSPSESASPWEVTTGRCGKRREKPGLGCLIR